MRALINTKKLTQMLMYSYFIPYTCLLKTYKARFLNHSSEEPLYSSFHGPPTLIELISAISDELNA